MIFLLIVVACLCVAWANGANDNFKGVATLFGSGTTRYRRALAWATVTTLAGSGAAFLLAGKLMSNFGGKGLVDETVVVAPDFAAAVAFGAGLTVLLATRLGAPVSTTHGLLGALLGAGLAAGSPINWGHLGSAFLIPLLLSPLLSLIATGVVYPLLHLARQRMGIARDVCLCVGQETLEVVSGDGHAMAMQRAEQLTASIGKTVTCRSRYEGQLVGVSVGEAIDRTHFLSSGLVSFARGLNDTPKIAALLLLVPAFGPRSSLFVVGLLIAVGGIVSARRVAETMSRKITVMNHGQGLTANLVTAVIVIGASRFGMPVSTTHVSCGSLFGLGAITGGARMRTIAAILLAWIVTLPLAGLLAAAVWFAISRF